MEARLKELDDERQTIYNLYRKKEITKTDMDRQLANVTVEENAYRSEQSQAKLASQRDIGDLKRLLNQVKESVVGSIYLLRIAVISDEDAARQWQLKKYFVDNFMEKVLVYKENSR